MELGPEEVTQLLIEDTDSVNQLSTGEELVDTLCNKTDFEYEQLYIDHKVQIVEETIASNDPMVFENLLVDSGDSIMLMSVVPNTKLKYHYNIKVLGIASCEPRLLRYLP